MDAVVLGVVAVLGLILGFVLGYRQGVVEGYDRAEAMITELIEQDLKSKTIHYSRLLRPDVEGKP